MNIEAYEFYDEDIKECSVIHDNCEFKSIEICLDWGEDTLMLNADDIKALAIAAGLIKEEEEK